MQGPKPLPNQWLHHFLGPQCPLDLLYPQMCKERVETFLGVVGAGPPLANSACVLVTGREPGKCSRRVCPGSRGETQTLLNHNKVLCFVFSFPSPSTPVYNNLFFYILVEFAFSPAYSLSHFTHSTNVY